MSVKCKLLTTFTQKPILYFVPELYHNDSLFQLSNSTTTIGEYKLHFNINIKYLCFNTEDTKHQLKIGMYLKNKIFV